MTYPYTVSGPGREHLLQEIKNLTEKGVLDLARIVPSGPDCEITEIFAPAPWVRGGAETYILPMVLKTHLNDYGVMFKACVAYSAGGDVESVLQGWIDRRKLLASFGINVPKLYGHGAGVVIEEHIPFKFEVVMFGSDRKEHFIEQLVFCVSAIISAGFRPRSLFEDLRSRGGDIVVVDFGEDLGASFDEQLDELAIEFLVDALFSRSRFPPEERRSIRKRILDSIMQARN